ncbi:hypothetical protein Cgig2_004665 [Carnegiea gigantea]|uniref:protein-tyrosine-phosphatase n=1 Tax=Carnegiea gigantea TaxID=171969 RepID=A0A9Q1JZW8_9CARY|nr:hypothetical protein Cgig2_004665 [Carnegiea gigantea]
MEMLRRLLRVSLGVTALLDEYMGREHTLGMPEARVLEEILLTQGGVLRDIVRSGFLQGVIRAPQNPRAMVSGLDSHVACVCYVTRRLFGGSALGYCTMADSTGAGLPFQNEKLDSENESSQKKIVYIWDMDETLILLKSLLNGTYAEAFNGLKDVQRGIDIGKMWEKYILDVCDNYFFYEQIENYNQPIVHALSQYDDGCDLSSYDFSQDSISAPSDNLNKRKLAYRHRIIAHKYKQGLHSILDQKTLELWNDLYEMTDSYTDGWLSSARTLLQHCSVHKEYPTDLPRADDSELQCINILVTSGSLVPSLVKCMLFRLDSLMTCENGLFSFLSLIQSLMKRLQSTDALDENSLFLSFHSEPSEKMAPDGQLISLLFKIGLYSSWDVGKLRCFSWIKERFSGPNVQFCVIGDGWEECEAAEMLRWPFVKIDPKPEGFHRFPGLTLKTVGHYLSVVYDRPDAESDSRDQIVSSRLI